MCIGQKMSLSVRDAMSHYVHVFWGWNNHQMTIRKPKDTRRLHRSRADSVHGNTQKWNGSPIDSEMRCRLET